MSTEIIVAVAVASATLYSIMAGVGWHVGGAHWKDPGPFLLVMPTIIGARWLTEPSARLPKAQVRQ